MAKSKQYHPTTAQLLREHKLMDTVADATLIITLTILCNEGEWSAEGLNEFKDRYIEFIKMYKNKELDMMALAKEIYDYCGIELFRKWRLENE